MRRWALLVAGGALWLLLAAVPVLADGGPHLLSVNSGTGGLNGDCASCHRAHTAAAADLLKTDMPGLCTNCHNGTKATTDVLDGVQYVPTSTAGTYQQTTILGALRGGGFDYALIDSANAARIISTVYPSGYLGHVGVLSTGQATTSSHGGASATVWGNGPLGSSGVGATGVTLACASCHNPHGNGQYRILETTPGADLGTAFVQTGRTVEVQDTANPTNATRNYTVLPGALASDVIAADYAPTQGDYWRWHTPWTLRTGPKDPMQTGWNGSTPTSASGNGGVAPSNGTGLMTAWCVQCHTRYSALPDSNAMSPALAPSGDATFMYRHDTFNVGCEQCHVSHGSNAQMTAAGSASVEWPGGSIGSDDSRLLKVANRGTCQLCHDPTNTAPLNTYVGPSPVPSP